MRRAECVAKLSDLDAEYDYDYSDESGETSEDLAVQEMQNGNKGAEDFVAPKPSFHLSMEQHLASIDTSVASKSTISTLAHYQDKDYLLDDFLKPPPKRLNIKVKSTECVIIDIAHPFHYRKISSEYIESQNPYLNWTSINNTPPSDFPVTVQENYKAQYQAQRTQLRFLHFVSPSNDAMSKLFMQRKESMNGRILFHYVGYGYPSSTDGKIFAWEPRPPAFHEFSIKKIYNMIKTPSWFIFDCDYAATYILHLEKAMVKCSEYKPSPNVQNQKMAQHMLARPVEWEDWYCMCATDTNEKLPTNCHLPRDFLSSALLTPVTISILCHILHNYRTSFPDPGFPLSYLRTVLHDEDGTIKSLLSVIPDAIAADYCTPSLYAKLFRKDKLLASLYRNFVIAQYLLHFYDVHPVSWPKIPDMSAHVLWQQFNATIDVWITSTLTPKPQFLNAFFTWTNGTFDTNLQNNQIEFIKPSLLTLLCQIPFTNVSNKDNALISLAEYAKAPNHDPSRLAASVSFNNLFPKLLEKFDNGKAYESLCTIILSLLQYDMSFASEFKKEISMDSLKLILFDESVAENIKTLVAAILACVVPSMDIVRFFCSTPDFLLYIKKAVSKSSPNTLLWLLILLKRTFDLSSVSPEIFFKDSVHIQIASLIQHNSYECRAAVVASLSCFMQSTENLINMHLILLCLPAFNDISYLVRYQTMLLMIRFLSTHFHNFVSIFKNEDQIQCNKSYTKLLSEWFGNPIKYPLDNFSQFAIEADTIAHRDDAAGEICKHAYYMIDYFAHDPHPSIRTSALRAKEFFIKMIQSEKTTPSSIKSISPPFGNYNSWHSTSFQEEAPTSQIEKTLQQENLPNPRRGSKAIFDSDSEVLFKISLNQLMNTDLSKAQDPIQQKVGTSSSRSYAMIDIPSMTLQIRSLSKQFNHGVMKLAFCGKTNDAVIATTNKWVYNLDDNFKILSRLRISDYAVSDLHKFEYQNDTYILACTCDGSMHLWNPMHSLCSATWRSDSNYLDESIPQYADIIQERNHLVSARDTNGIDLWDINTQKLITEWDFSPSQQATALSLHPANDNVVIVGYANGEIVGIDMRESKKAINLQAGDRILKMTGNRNGADFLYIATSSGRNLVWNSSANSLECCGPKIPLSQFDAHSALPLLACQSPNGTPIITNPTGSTLYELNSIESNSVFAFHPILPTITFGTPTGALYSYNILLGG